MLDQKTYPFLGGVNNINEYSDNKLIYKKGTPIHVRGALLYNHLVKTKKLEKQYKLIQSGDKIKFCYLKMPNTLRENVISFPDFLPKEFALDKYIDYDTQYEKTYIKPPRSHNGRYWMVTGRESNLRRFFRINMKLNSFTKKIDGSIPSFASISNFEL